EEVRWGSRDGTPILANGHPWIAANEMARTGADLTDPNWREHPLFKNNIVTDVADEIGKGIDGWLASLGYLREGLYYRCARETDEEYTVALFSHGGSSAAAMGHILNLTFPYMCAVLHIPFTGITVIRMERRPGGIGLPVLESAGDGRHIRGVALE
ncbi:MAG: hypothetical protein IKX85_07415, partial [Clostridia bacterium]|nr:hypothetical protein [Clostridia bacterium]